MKSSFLIALTAALTVLVGGIVHAQPGGEAAPGQQPPAAGGQGGEPAPAPDAAQAAEIDKYIKQLGDAEFAKREEAYKKLHDIGRPALEKLKEALKSEDAEIRGSAQRLIDEISGPRGGDDGGVRLVIVPGGGNVRVQMGGGMVQPGVAQPAEVVKEYVIDETVDKVKMKYEFTEKEGKGIDVAVTKTDADGKVTSETLHFDSADEMKKKNEALHKKYLAAVEKGPVAQRGGNIPLMQRAAGDLLMRIKLLERMPEGAGRGQFLKNIEDELLKTLQALDAVEQKMAGRSLKNALDFDTWTLLANSAIPGVQVRPVDEALKAQLSLKGGILVVAVDEKSPAAGVLKPYDIIKEVDGAALTVAQFNAVCTAAATGKGKIDLKILRASKEETVTVTLPKPEPPKPDAAGAVPAPDSNAPAAKPLPPVPAPAAAGGND
jgi:hypothetical protein